MRMIVFARQSFAHVRAAHVRALASVQLALILAACQSVPGVSPSSTGPTSAPAPTPTVAAAVEQVTVTYSNKTPHFLPIWIANDSGLFQQNGLNVDLKFVSGGQVLMASLVSGEAPIGAVGGSEAMSAAAGGADVAVIAILVPYSPWSLYVPASVTSAEQLKGQRVGVVTAGGSADIAARAGLPKIGLAADRDVTIAATGSTENLNSALENGAVQGAMLTPPYSFIFQNKGFHALFDLVEQKLPSADTGIVVQRAYLTNHRPTVQRYVDAIVEAIKREKQDKPYAVTVLKKYMELDDDVAAGKTYDYFSTLIRPWVPYVATEQFAVARDSLAAKNDKLRDFDVNTIIDNSLLKSAVDRGLAGGS